MHRLGEGTTGMDSYIGPVHNPWNTEYIAGGSSSGSAAAVASGMCYATLDTDAIGSCRLPAACCGVVGFKGTYGLVDPTGILEGEEDPGEMIRWFAHPGIMARTVDDAAIVLDVLAERSERAAGHYFEGLTENQNVRIGVGDNFKNDTEVLIAFERAVEKIRGLGCPMRSAAVPFYNSQMGLGNIRSDRDAIASQTFKDVDVILLPTTTTTVPAIRDVGNNALALSPENTIFANYYGLPAITVRCGFDSHGLPLGLQIVGRPWKETAVLHLASRYQQLN
jgi:aspartyl-tRNA(Asn)/glutamyl-tRNA(Gln) amidotransferase subunit A